MKKYPDITIGPLTVVRLTAKELQAGDVVTVKTSQPEDEDKGHYGVVLRTYSLPHIGRQMVDLSIGFDSIPWTPSMEEELMVLRIVKKEYKFCDYEDCDQEPVEGKQFCEDHMSDIYR
jgi:hypothetical protein